MPPPGSEVPALPSRPARSDTAARRSLTLLSGDLQRTGRRVRAAALAAGSTRPNGTSRPTRSAASAFRPLPSRAPRSYCRGCWADQPQARMFWRENAAIVVRHVSALLPGRRWCAYRPLHRASAPVSAQPVYSASGSSRPFLRQRRCRSRSATLLRLRRSSTSGASGCSRSSSRCSRAFLSLPPSHTAPPPPPPVQSPHPHSRHPTTATALPRHAASHARTPAAARTAATSLALPSTHHPACPHAHVTAAAPTPAPAAPRPPPRARAG